MPIGLVIAARAMIKRASCSPPLLFIPAFQNFSGHSIATNK